MIFATAFAEPHARTTHGGDVRLPAAFTDASVPRHAPCALASVSGETRHVFEALKIEAEETDEAGVTVRPVFVGALGIVAVGAAAAVGLTSVAHAHGQADARSATAAAHRVATPVGATPSHDCHGDGLVVCFTINESVIDATTAVNSSVGSAAAKPATVTCSRVAAGAASGQRSCLVAVRWGAHGVFAFVEPHVVSASGHPAVRGTLVSVTAN